MSKIQEAFCCHSIKETAQPWANDFDSVLGEARSELLPHMSSGFELVKID